MCLDSQQTLVGKKLLSVTVRRDGEDYYFRWTFEGGAYYEWFGELAAKHGYTN